MTRRDVVGLAVAAGLGLGGAALLRRCGPQPPPSPWVGRVAPPLAAPRLEGGAPFDSASLGGRVWLLNVFASWCAPCIEEHPLLLALARDVPAAMLVGLNFVDDPAAARAWLARRGNPYGVVLSDPQGQHAAGWQVAGVPQTFVVDGGGRIAAHHAGRLTPTVMDRTVTPLVRGGYS